MALRTPAHSAACSTARNFIVLVSFSLVTSLANAEVINEAPDVAAQPSGAEAAATITPDNLREMPITGGVNLDPLAEQRITDFRGQDFLTVEPDTALAQEPSQLADPLYTAPESELRDATPLASPSAIQSRNTFGQLLSLGLLLAGLFTLSFARSRIGAPLRALDEEDQTAAA